MNERNQNMQVVQYIYLHVRLLAVAIRDVLTKRVLSFSNLEGVVSILSNSIKAWNHFISQYCTCTFKNGLIIRMYICICNSEKFGNTKFYANLYFKQHFKYFNRYYTVVRFYRNI